MLTKPMYTSTTVVDVERQSAQAVPFSAGAGDIGPASEFLPSQIRLMQSREIAERVVRKLNLLADPQFNPKHFAEFRPDAKGNVPKARGQDVVDAAIGVQKLLDVTILRGTSLVEISAVAPSPELAAAIPNAVADAYIDWNVESRVRLIGQSSQFLASQIEQAKSEIEAKEKELFAFGRARDITVDPNAKSSRSTGTSRPR